MILIKYVNVRILLCLSFFLCLGFAFAQDMDDKYIKNFFGLSTEFIMVPADPNSPILSSTPESISLIAAFGNRDFFSYPAIRARGGLGFWPGRYFSATVGVEVAIFELLNSMQARFVGLYGYVDGIMRIGRDGLRFAARPSCRILVPLNSSGGLAVGVGYDTALGLTWHVEYLSGFYALK